jgi:hypothetical protein
MKKPEQRDNGEHHKHCGGARRFLVTVRHCRRLNAVSRGKILEEICWNIYEVRPHE